MSKNNTYKTIVDAVVKFRQKTNSKKTHIILISKSVCRDLVVQGVTIKPKAFNYLMGYQVIVDKWGILGPRIKVDVMKEYDFETIKSIIEDHREAGYEK